MTTRTQTIRDYPLVIEVEYTFKKGMRGDRDTPDDNDEYTVTKMLYNGVELVNEPLRDELEEYIMNNPERL